MPWKVGAAEAPSSKNDRGKEAGQKAGRRHPRAADGMKIRLSARAPNGVAALLLVGGAALAGAAAVSWRHARRGNSDRQPARTSPPPPSSRGDTRAATARLALNAFPDLTNDEFRLPLRTRDKVVNQFADGSMHLPSAPLASKMDLPVSGATPGNHDIDEPVFDYTQNRNMEQRDTLKRQDTPMPMRRDILGKDAQEALFLLLKKQ